MTESAKPITDTAATGSEVTDELDGLTLPAYLEAIHRVQAIIEFDLDGTITDANALFLGAMGYELNDIVGRHHRMFCEPSYAESPEYQALWAKLRNGTPDSGEYKRLDKNGNAVWINASYNPVIDRDGRVVKIVKFATDVTATKQQQISQEAKIAAISRSQAVIEFTLDGTIITANDNFLSAMGYDLSEVTGKHHRMFCSEELVASSEYRAFWERLAQGEYEAGDYMRIHKDGSEVWIHASYNPIFDPEGKAIGVVKFATDITEAKNREMDNQSKLSAIDRSQAVIEFTLDGHVVDANENFLNTMGYSLDEIVGQHHRMFCTPEFANSPAYAELWRGLATGQLSTGEYDRISKDGRTVWINASYNPIFDPNGRVVKVVKYATDITEEKTRNAIYEGQLNAISAAQAVIEFDLKGNVTAANANFLNAVGYTEDEVIGQHHRLFCPDELVRSRDYKDFWDRLGRGESSTGRFERKAKDGSVVWLNANYNPIPGPDGSPIGVVKIATDITEEVNSQRDISERVSQSSDALNNMSNEISGEIQKVAKNAQSLGATTEEMSGCVEELSASIDSIAQNTKAADEQARQTQDQAEQGAKAVEESIDAMAMINKSSEEIKDILGVISEIASQTNLLAFNAAIEAARAGEHGLGFSVVADEVRKLAERSSQAAQNISKLIGESTRRIEHGSQISRKAGEAFETIMKGVIGTANSISQISSATVEQQAAARDVASSIEQVAAAAESSAEVTQFLANSTEHLSEEASKMLQITKASQSAA